MRVDPSIENLFEAKFSASSNTTGYIVPPAAAPLLQASAPAASPAVSAVASISEVSENPSFFGRIFSWIKRLFGYDAEVEKTEQVDLQERVSVDDYMQKVAESESKLLENIKESNNEDEVKKADEILDIFSKKFNIERAYILALVDNIKLNGEDTVHFQIQMKRIRDAILDVKNKIDESIQKKQEAAVNTKFYEKISFGTASLLMATVLVGAALTFATGGAGGVVAVALAGIQGAAAFTTGTTGLVSAYYRWQTNSAEAKIIEASEDRRQGMFHLNIYMGKQKESLDFVNDSWMKAHQAELKRANVIRAIQD